MKYKIGSKTSKHHDFFTPEVICEDLFNMYYPMLKYLYKQKGSRINVLEPACGSGNLIWKLLESDIKVRITCMDIQPKYLSDIYYSAVSEGYKVLFADNSVIIKN